MKNIIALKKELISICKMMHSKDFICATDGNLSIRLGKDKFLITASGVHKGFITQKDLIIINKKGEVVQGKGKVSTEWRMHLKAYELRPDVNAVIHSHPALIIAYTIAGVPLPENILPETILTMGGIPLTEYSTPTSPKNADIIEEHIKKYDAVVLSRHGVLTVGKDLLSAFGKLEKLEHTAKSGIMAKILGGVNPLPTEEIQHLFKLGIDMGFLNPACIKK